MSADEPTVLPKKVAVAGATGMIGRRLVTRLTDLGVAVVALARPASNTNFPADAEVRHWSAFDTRTPIEDADALVNLVGPPIFCEALEQSSEARAGRTSTGSNAIADDGAQILARSVRHLIVSIEFAGDHGNEPIVETTAPGPCGFLGTMCRQWEAHAEPMRRDGRRLVLLRYGLVLGVGGSTFAGFLPAYQRGVAFWFGPGTQWTSWIHVDDTVGLIVRALRSPTFDGPLIGVAGTCLHKEFCEEFGRAVSRTVRFGLPTPLAHLVFGERADLFLHSHRADPRLARANGHRFAFPTLSSAFDDLVREARQAKPLTQFGARLTSSADPA